RPAPRARTRVPHPPRLRPAVEALEDRRLLSTVYAVTTAGTLISFDSTFPARILGSPRPIRGLQGGESILAIDVRPSTGQLYGVGSASRLYVLDPTTGDATPVGPGPFGVGLNVPEVGADFDPVTGQLRVVSDALLTLRVDPDTGQEAGTDSPLTYVTGGPAVVGLAYTNDVAGAAATTLYGIDFQQDTLVRQGSVGGSPLPAGGGQLFTVGPLGVD